MQAPENTLSQGLGTFHAAEPAMAFPWPDCADHLIALFRCQTRIEKHVPQGVSFREHGWTRASSARVRFIEDVILPNKGAILVAPKVGN
jgi:hypothetical protein